MKEVVWWYTSREASICEEETERCVTKWGRRTMEKERVRGVMTIGMKGMKVKLSAEDMDV